MHSADWLVMEVLALVGVARAIQSTLEVKERTANQDALSREGKNRDAP